MSYVYSRVSKDHYSNQSPHFGFLDGDGDFIFAHPPFTSADQTDEQGGDILMDFLSVEATQELRSEAQSLSERVKDYLSDPRYRIRLDDLASENVRLALSQLGEERFSVLEQVTAEDFAERIRNYEDAISRLNVLTILLARWGNNDHQSLLERILGRLADSIDSRGGSTIWLGLRWYPIMYLMYSGGIAALSSRNYNSLATILRATVGSNSSGHESADTLTSAVKGILEVDRAEMFKRLPGYERYYTPRSEYLFKTLQPQLEDLLFLGKSYEDIFDRFEILYALSYADLEMQRDHHVWGPPGRFGWKKGRGAGANPFSDLSREANQHAGDWSPLKAGLFAGSIDRFNQIAKAYKSELLDNLHWY